MIELSAEKAVRWASLKRQRASVRSACTRIKTFLDTTNPPLNIETRSQISLRKNSLEKLYKEFCKIQGEIEDLEQEVDETAHSDFEETYYALMSRMLTLLEVNSGASNSGSHPINASNFGFNSGEHQQPGSAPIKLPKISLPTFSGKYEDWLPFFNVFESVIDKNVALQATQKFQYLQSCLSGTASDVVQSLELSDANYTVAWNLLQERYNNPRVIVHAHIKEILEIPRMSRENYSELRSIVDMVQKHVRALTSLGRQVEAWDDILVYILTAKLDSRTNKEWQASLKGTALPTLKELLDFVTHRFQALEVASTHHDISISSLNKPKLTKDGTNRTSINVATFKIRCSFCNAEHPISQCQSFLKMSIPNRIKEIKSKRLCLNCLRTNKHTCNSCPSGTCRVCQSKHNTLLHIPRNENQNSSREFEQSAVVSTDKGSKTSQQNTTVSVNTSVAPGYNLLSTAIVHAYDSSGNKVLCRALLDPGSQANFISRKCLKTLRLPVRTSQITISGIGQLSSSSNEMSEVKIQSRLNSFSASLSCVVTDKVTARLPTIELKRNQFSIPANITLADPEFCKPSDVDILIGVELFWELICVGRINVPPGHPVLQKTHLGWILAGKMQIPEFNPNIVNSYFISVNDSGESNDISRFWEIEDLKPETKVLSGDNAICEDHFVKTVARDDEGRFIIQLPFKTDVSELGNSRGQSLKRFLNLEARLNRDPVLKEQYTEFLNEYASLGHMRLLSDHEVNDEEPHYYLPHHCVLKPTSISTKLRVVFDASAKAAKGKSLNDILFVGPVVQDDLLAILLRFRLHTYVFTADIRKMYRQISLSPTQTRFHRILWRAKSKDPIRTYELLTLTYGTAPASYIATRCLIYLAEKYRDQFPLGAKCAAADFYMDDVLTGSDSFEETKLMIEQTEELLSRGQLPLDKWRTNEPQLFNSFTSLNENCKFHFDKTEGARVLGIAWDASRDSFGFQIEPEPLTSKNTKRSILAETAKIFDPLGLLAPVIITPKLIIQKLWSLNLHWDSSLPCDLEAQWHAFRRQLPCLNDLQTDRSVKPHTFTGTIELHGFCDSSERAYGACVYVRAPNIEGSYEVSLLCAKSKVAPLKSLSLPRLELCAATLLATLMKKVLDSINRSNYRVFLWSDSMIVLNWISSSSRKWSTFVSNRVGEIQRCTDSKDWNHVVSLDNPADILSRGAEPLNLLTNKLWWEGPIWLKTPQENWPESKFQPIAELPELKRTAVVAAAQAEASFDNTIASHSSLPKLLRIISYCLRFIKALKSEKKYKKIRVSPSEMQVSLKVLCKHIQSIAFSSEIKQLEKEGMVDRKSKVLSLSPFLDGEGILRVGGRLRESELPYDTRHPILLPKNHPITSRLVIQEHERNLHSGIQLTVASIRQKFWPISLRSITRKIVRECVTCAKAKPIVSEAIMGQLPIDRLRPSRPFSHSGVDYAGPFLLRSGTRRNSPKVKAYVSVFVCFTTKAVHLELVGDLTTAAFIGALKRFLARRGNVTKLYSDNGTTFVGAQNELKQFYEFFMDDPNQIKIQDFLSQSQVTWTFIPPNAPHCGGLWEAAVKSFKFHLKRTLVDASLTFEEFSTLLCEIESILNSRPITPLSEDPNDFEVLTPGHFLIGEAMNSFPNPDLTLVKENRLVRWQRVEQLRQNFWRRWQLEYLHNLQAKQKWKENKGDPLKLDQLVLVKQQGLGPLQWLMGRVVELRPGSDGVVRSAVIKTIKGSFVRPITKLCVLPIKNSDD